MSTKTTLKAERREGTGKGVARKLRSAGQLPAVVYGGDGDTDHISLNAHDAEYLFRNISVDNTIVEIDIEGEKGTVQTLVREIQTHPWKAHVLHVDFLRIQKGVAVEMDVPLHLTGTPVGVQMSGGIVEQIVHDIGLRCIPSKIPEVIEVDISAMDVGDVLHAEDIALGEGVELMIAGGQTICMVNQPKGPAEADTDEDEEGAESAADESAGAEG